MSTDKCKKITAQDLNLDYYPNFLSKTERDTIFIKLENEIEYFSGEMARIKVFGRWYDLPRQQVAFGDEGLQYTFSGITVPALPWPKTIADLREKIISILGYDYNFVLVNRYRNGLDHIGEHRDDEKGLDKQIPIASLSLGQHRHFVLRHKNVRNKTKDNTNIPSVKILLEHGSLLLMNSPTNQFWYHSLPKKKAAVGVRVNLTFRHIIPESCIRS